MNEIIELLREFSRDLRSLNEDINEDKHRFYGQLSEEWLDSSQVMDILKISKRNLQYMRNHGDLLYSRVRGKCYYRASEVREMLEKGEREQGEGRRGTRNREKGEGRRGTRNREKGAVNGKQ